MYQKTPWFLKQLKFTGAGADANEIRTERLLLRPLRYRDAKDFYEYAKDEQVARYVLWDAHTSLNQTKAILRSQMMQCRQEGLLTMAITMKETRRMVGTIGLVNRDWDNHTAEVGFSLARAVWGQGLMTEALTAYLRFIFDQNIIHRIEALHDVDNPASGKVMKKAGMKEEGLLKERIYYKMRYASVRLYAAIRDEWLRENAAR
ncbi:MAG: GNAT family N-acetyltransferase [Bacillota bacterium]|nr:GNAT family N-acetyltransferase [Bacillota bacterium]